MGLDDGCSEDRKHEIPCVSKCDFDIFRYSTALVHIHSRSLTSFDGDSVGTFVGLTDGETDGSLLGLFEGD